MRKIFFKFCVFLRKSKLYKKKITGIKIDTTDNSNNFCRKTDMLYHQKKQKQIHSFTWNIFSIILTSINCQIFKNIGDIPSSAEGFLVKYENVELIFFTCGKKGSIAYQQSPYSRVFAKNRPAILPEMVKWMNRKVQILFNTRKI